MENSIEHSKAKLALAVFTSPGAAFEEISRRKLLGTALAISAATGAVAMIPPTIAFFSGERLQWLVLSQSNPITWLGLMMLYAVAMQRLLKWIGTQVDYVSLLTAVGWAQVSMLLVQIATVLLTISGLTMSTTLASAGSASIALFSMWYVFSMGSALQSLITVNRFRGMLTYVVVHLAIWIGLTYTYVSTRVSGFEGASGGVIYAASGLGYTDKLPWAAASVLGLALGIAEIGRHFDWQPALIRTRAFGAAALALVIFAGFALALHTAGYYGQLRRGYIFGMGQQYVKAAEELDSFSHASKDNARLLKDIGDLYFLAKKNDLAIRRYKKAIDNLQSREVWDKKMWLAQAHDGLGAVYDQQGKYTEALAEFEKASKVWPEFREPWVRKAVTYNRMARYDSALESADHAMKKLGSEAVVAWVALAQASARSGNAVQAKAAIAVVADRDSEIASRIGKNLDDWKSAVDRLSRSDLKYPLEREPAPPPTPKQATQKAKSPDKK